MSNVFFAGFHNRWNRNVQVPHPNILIFIRKMKDEQKRIHITISAADNGQSPPKSRQIYRRMQRRVKRLKDDYNNGRWSLAAYWKAVAYTIHTFN